MLQHLPKDIQPMVPGLLVVFVLGIVLSTFEFMFAFMHKAKDPSIRGRWHPGGMRRAGKRPAR